MRHNKLCWGIIFIVVRKPKFLSLDNELGAWLIVTNNESLRGTRCHIKKLPMCSVPKHESLLWLMILDNESWWVTRHHNSEGLNFLSSCDNSGPRPWSGLTIRYLSRDDIFWFFLHILISVFWFFPPFKLISMT